MNRRRFLGSAAAVGWAVHSGLPGRLAAQPAAESDLRLNSNENSLGLSESARRAAIEGLGDSNRYPFRHYKALKAVLAESVGVEAENIVLGNGSSEILYLAVQAVASGGGKIVMADPTFESVADYAAPQKIRVDKTPLLPDRSLDLARMLKTAHRSKGGALVYICNPNNPTGTLTPTRRIHEALDSAPRNWIVIDEAYHEYVRDDDYRSFAPEAVRRPGVLVSRTFSKIYALAGLRLGFGVAHPDTAKILASYSPDVPINNLAIRAATAALSDLGYLARSIHSNFRARQVLTGTLDDLGLEYMPSHTNFVMHRIQGALDLYIDRMRQRGIRVGRPFPPMTTWNRLSLGLPEEMERFCGLLRQFRGEGWV